MTIKLTSFDRVYLTKLLHEEVREAEYLKHSNTALPYIKFHAGTRIAVAKSLLSKLE